MPNSPNPSLDGTEAHFQLELVVLMNLYWSRIKIDFRLSFNVTRLSPHSQQSQEEGAPTASQSVTKILRRDCKTQFTHVKAAYNRNPS